MPNQDAAPPTMGKGQKVLSHDGSEQGELTGATRSCTLGGCNGRRYYVRWPDGKTTCPCSKGLTWNAERGAWQIL